MHSSQPRDLVSCTEYPTPAQTQVPAVQNRSSTQERNCLPQSCWAPGELLPSSSSPLLLQADFRLWGHRAGAVPSLPCMQTLHFSIQKSPHTPALPRSDYCRASSRTLKLKKLPHIWRKRSQSWICDFDEQNANTNGKNLSLWDKWECDMNVNNIPTLLEAGSCHTALPPQQTLTEVQIQPASQLNSQTCRRVTIHSPFCILYFTFSLFCF